MQRARQAHPLPPLSCSGLQGPDLLPAHPRAPGLLGSWLASADGMLGRKLGEEHVRRGLLPSSPGSCLRAVTPCLSGFCSPQAPLPRGIPYLIPSARRRSLGYPTVACAFPTRRPHVSDESFIKLCLNYPISSVPSASCWDLTDPRRQSKQRIAVYAEPCWGLAAWAVHPGSITYYLC